MQTFQLGNDSVDVSGEIAVVASEILGRNFPANESLLEQVNSAHRVDGVYGKEVLALCESWPNHQLLRQAYDELESRYYADDVSVRLASRVGSSEDVIEWIERLCRAIRLPQNAFLLFVRPIVRRIARDEKLIGILKKKLTSTSNSTEKVTIFKMMSAAIGLHSDLRAWCEKELEHQEKTPEAGMDIFFGQFVPVEHAILDCLISDNSGRC